jgi:hypothetical protein
MGVVVAGGFVVQAFCVVRQAAKRGGVQMPIMNGRPGALAHPCVELQLIS